jgi:NitT/TauT family transport system substrate-binding protein
MPNSAIIIVMKSEFKIGYLPILDHLVLGVADHNDGGMFEHGEVSSKQFKEWNSLAEAFESGELDGAFLLAPLAVKLYRKNGQNLRVVLLGHREGQVLVTKPEIKSATDIRGMRFSIPHEYSTHNILLQKFLIQAGLKAKDVSITVATGELRKFSDRLASGEIDGFIAAEPFGTQARQNGAGHILATSADIQASHVIDCVLVLSKNIIDQHPDFSQELVKSLVRAGGFMNAYPRQTAEIGEVFLNFPKKVLLEALTHDRGHIVFWDLLPRVDDFEHLFAMGKECGLDVDPSDSVGLVDDRFARMAYREWTIGVRQEKKDRGAQRTLPGNYRDAVRRVEELLGRTVTLRAISVIASGDKYPLDVARLPLTTATDVFSDDGVYQPSDKDSNIKGLHITRSSEGNDPDYVLLQLSDSEETSLIRALAFGGQGRALLAVKGLFEGVQRGESAIKYQIGRDTLTLLRFSAFRLLPILWKDEEK